MPRKANKRKQSVMEFVCQRCGAQWSEMRQSGRASWCNDCKPIVKAEQDRERARRYRQRKRTDDKLSEFKARWGLPSGLPRRIETTINGAVKRGR